MGDDIEFKSEADLKKHLRGGLTQRELEQRREIERLREELRAAKNTIDLMRPYAKRIEELERKIAEHIYDESNPPTWISIDKTKIDEAWEYIREDCGAHPPFIRMLYRLLKIFGIERCEGCGGDGFNVIQVPVGAHHVTREMAMDAGMPEIEGSVAEIEYGAEQEPCPSCNGHRWVVKP